MPFIPEITPTPTSTAFYLDHDGHLKKRQKKEENEPLPKFSGPTPVVSSFPFLPLTTQFTRPATCGHVHTADVWRIDDDPGCMPEGFTVNPTRFFSPGISCPAGYTTACHDTAGVASITTVICCPSVHPDLPMTCPQIPWPQRTIWSSYFCTFEGLQVNGPKVSATISPKGVTSTVAVTFNWPEGLNAWGVRMVHESADLAKYGSTSSSTSSSTSKSTSSSGTPSDSSDSSSTSSPTITPDPADGATSGNVGGQATGTGSPQLSSSAKVAISVTVPIVVAAALLFGLFLFWRRRKNKLGGSGGGSSSALVNDSFGPVDDGPSAQITHLNVRTNPIGPGAAGAGVPLPPPSSSSSANTTTAGAGPYSNPFNMPPPGQPSTHGASSYWHSSANSEIANSPHVGYMHSMLPGGTVGGSPALPAGAAGAYKQSPTVTVSPLSDEHSVRTGTPGAGLASAPHELPFQPRQYAELQASGPVPSFQRAAELDGGHLDRHGPGMGGNR